MRGCFFRIERSLNTSRSPAAKEKQWFVATITNNDARDLKIAVAFLSPGKKYEAAIYYDDPNSQVRTKISIRRTKVDASSVLDVKLLASGGQAVWIRPVAN